MLALLLALASTTGLMGADDLRYARYAQGLAEGDYRGALNEWPRHNALRFGVIVPVALVYRAFGVNEWSTMVVPLIASTLSVVLLIEVGRRMFGLVAGVVAGLLYATFPLRLIYGGILVPELIAECWVLLSALCYLRARDQSGAWWVISGMLLGVAYMTKEPALFIGGAFLVYTVWQRQWRGTILYAVGVALIGAAEHAYYYAVWGDVLFRFHVTRPYTVVASETFFTLQGKPLLHFLFRKYPDMMVVPHIKYGLHGLTSVVAAAAALLLKPRRDYGLALLWCILPGLYLNFGSFSFARYAPVPRDERYIEFLFPPLMLLAGVAFGRALTSGAVVARSAAAVLGVVMVAGAASGLAMRGQIAFSEDMSVLREIVRMARTSPKQTIYTDNDRWRRGLNVLDPSIVSPSREAATFIVLADPVGLPKVELAVGSMDDKTPEGQTAIGER
jgi:4-amino-4-deoxy-L-arabinose transferase-like glycosyltransferase